MVGKGRGGYARLRICRPLDDSVRTFFARFDPVGRAYPGRGPIPVLIHVDAGKEYRKDRGVTPVDAHASATGH